ncbi:branched-chain amino acid ABC transporter permease [Verminephrobacter eiseniae]|uniref:branched-chain amino acid ABC transporter permease n=1 Tax=Verminephrobacter eiseniae TaxID=364317 RepID=UPI002237FC9E|nr:branched-chain amino acid ABC transporter permease [Verminephrobacter eiseniae]MCW5233246.1 branched-chain amino acid ABC transporter permease [Verminephrobacter eiseniae]MCW5295200.1 branched-chain amino acid ABC transporter permease [Verminephrobacter eiseniae]MCW8184148.1 branched-chain amino acid ABC transporter permease [Verminephrobacter eiseniae]MCW8222679.1 branched-chain amino acid ABC transporter permease [Verminephrobacter eiseniae]MCW8234149.1 branched-chain amino acid ABC trans
MKLTPRIHFSALILVLPGLLPLYAAYAGEAFYLTLFCRILIFAIAAASLNLVLGYGGMVSFGHALYFGLGAYVVGILARHGWTNGWTQLSITLACCAMVGGLTGIIALRTTGIAFIMITLAFSQMSYFLFVSLKQYGGDDGLSIAARSDFGILDFNDSIVFYYVCYAALLTIMFFGHRLVHARFGMVLRATKSNERRMLALGFATLHYRLLAYVLSAMVCGVAGMLYANLTLFSSPSYMSWSMSGDLIIMVVLGGVASVMGPLLGAMGLILLEEILKSHTDHWMMILGVLIVAIVLLTKRGIDGLLQDMEPSIPAKGKVP